MIWLSVALGGALGACLRYGLFLSIGSVGGVPVGTFVANAVGSLAMGFLAAMFRGADAWDSPLRLFLLVGVLGALTTFSTFAMEAVDALRAGRMAVAMAYVVGTVMITVAGCWIGYAVGQSFGR
ncbi:MAG: fluoride efflux transporter CrcB [Alphaproteobacteria bacterium]|jgi:CrcB protein